MDSLIKGNNCGSRDTFRKSKLIHKSSIVNKNRQEIGIEIVEEREMSYSECSSLARLLFEMWKMKFEKDGSASTADAEGNATNVKAA